MQSRGVRFNVTLLVFIAIGLLASCSVLWERHLSEVSNDTAVLLSDYRALNDFSRQQGIAIDKLLNKVKSMGVTALAVDEINRDDMLTQGWARLVNSYELADLRYQGQVGIGIDIKPSCVYFIANSDKIAKIIAAQARENLGRDRVSIVDEANHVVALEADMRQVAVMGFGVPTDIVDELVKKYGFKVWVRPWNSQFYRPANLKRVIASLARPGVEGVIFGGLRNEVLGFPNELSLVSEELAKAKLKIGVIELPRISQQKGIQTLARLAPQSVVRVMSVSTAQQAKTDPQAVASMYCLGTRERNIRLLYVRPYFDNFDSMNAVEASDLMINTLVSNLKGRLGEEATVFGTVPDTGRGLNGLNFRLIFIALAIASGWCSLLRTSVNIPSKWSMGILVATLLATVVAILTGIGLSQLRLILALAGLMVFPIWGLVLLFPVWEKVGDGAKFSNAVAVGWKILGIASAFALMGGIIGSSCLPDVTYMLSIDLFRGVKLHSLIVPALTIVCWIIYQNKRGALKRVRQILCQEVRIWHLLVFVALAGLCAFYLVRTGNSGGDAVVSDVERAFRRWLDFVLGVRPRFKEFLLGNPALFCIPALLACRLRGLVPFAVLATAVGEASLAGTYAHLHTPIAVSLWRSALGVAFGGILGMGLSWIIYGARNLFDRYISPSIKRWEGEDI